jgi:hypothetical protein
VNIRHLVWMAVLIPARAHGGPTLYGWLPETTTTPPDSMELATSLYERDNLGALHERSSWLVWTPSVGLTRCLELAFPIALATRTQDDASPWSGIGRYGAELRWRVPPHGIPIHSLARFGVSRNVELQTQVRTEVELAAAYDIDRVQIEAAIGGVLDINFGHLHEELRPGVGTSVLVTDELRLGAELHAELSRDATVTSWAVIGPDVAWQHGRFWLAGVLGIGIKNITAAPRLNIGMVW